MVEKNLKLVIDTNILISATISKQTRNYLDKIISEEQIEIYFSKELHREYEEVKTRRKIAKYLNPASEKYSKLIFFNLEGSIMQLFSMVAKLYSKSLIFSSKRFINSLVSSRSTSESHPLIAYRVLM